MYTQIPAFYAKVPALYAEMPAFYAVIYRFGFHCVGNIYGQVAIDYLYSIANYRARVLCGRGNGAGARRWQKQLRNCAREIILERNLLRQDEA